MSNTIEKIECFTWNGEQFSVTFNVNLAKKLTGILTELGHKPNVQITIEQAKEALGFNTEQRDPEAVNAANIANPIIAVQMYNTRTTRLEMLIIDGWHRLEKFASLNEGTLPCWVLPHEGLEALVIEGELPKEQT